MLCLLPLLLVAHPSLAEDKQETKEEKKKEPPVITLLVPLGVTPGLTNTIKIRGQHLTHVSELRFGANSNLVQATIKSQGKADPPKDTDAKRAGDTQLEVELILSPELPSGTNAFTVVSPDGESPPHWLWVAPAGSLLEEKEPNGGFRQTQEIRLGQAVQGSIREARDVDVFRLDGKAGQQLVAEAIAVRLGSLLDSVLTLHDSRGHILATADDSDGATDSTLRVKLPADGAYYLSVIDAHDKGSPVHVYLLDLKPGK